jgi:hypothetical protein
MPQQSQSPNGSAGEILVLTQGSSKLLVAFVVLVAFVALIVGYSIYKAAQATSSRPAEKAGGAQAGGLRTFGASLAATASTLAAAAVPSNILQTRDPNVASWRSMLQPPAIEISQAPPGAKTGNAAVRSDTMAEIQKRTRDDGALRQVAVNGQPVPPQLVAETVFNNRNFATRANYEFPQFENKLSHDKSSERPRSMFGPLTAPLAAGNFAMDISGKIIK